jgi:Domain of unknown function (DUF3472)/Domain of unknown function (DUF5077)
MKFCSSFLTIALSFVVLQIGWSQTNALPDTIRTLTINLLGNGYVYPQQLDEDSGLIQKNGLSAWEDKNVSTRVYFYPQQRGMLSVSLKIKAPENSSRIKITLGSTGKSFEIKVNPTKNVLVLQVGEFMIDSPRYHFLEIKGLSKNGKNFPAIESVLLSGDAAKDLKFNSSEYRGAPSVHLIYEAPKDTTISWFYTEVNVPLGINGVNAYYETNGFADGYMGIQVNSDTERRFIFSVWSNYKTDDPKQIPDEYAVKLVQKGENVFSGDFGNEGSGGHSHLVFPWKNGATYKLLVGAKPQGDHTIFTGYYFAPENGSWKLIARWEKSKTGGKLLSGLYAFVENFGPNGNDYFKANYSNQWVRTVAGDWIELTKCHLTTTASPLRHPRYDYGAGVENNCFYMFTGGFIRLNNLAPHSLIQRAAIGVSPAIDFSSLPEK